MTTLWVRGQSQLYLKGAGFKAPARVSEHCQVRLGLVWLDKVRLGQVRFGQVRLGQVSKQCQVRLGQVSEHCQVRFGQVWLGQYFYICNLASNFLYLKISNKRKKCPLKFTQKMSTRIHPNYAPTYLLLPLGKRGSKWGDFHWAMGCV